MSGKLKKNVQTNNTSQISYQDALALFGANNFSFTSTGDNAEFAVPNTVTIKKFSLAPDA